MDYIKASVEEQTTKHEIRHIDVYGLKGIEDLKRPLITTPLYRIGIKECYHPPVGFASNPIGELNSEGNEKYVIKKRRIYNIINKFFFFVIIYQ